MPAPLWLLSGGDLRYGDAHASTRRAVARVFGNPPPADLVIPRTVTEWASRRNNAPTSAFSPGATLRAREDPGCTGVLVATLVSPFVAIKVDSGNQPPLFLRAWEGALPSEVHVVPTGLLWIGPHYSWTNEHMLVNLPESALDVDLSWLFPYIGGSGVASSGTDEERAASPREERLPLGLPSPPSSPPPAKRTRGRPRGQYKCKTCDSRQYGCHCAKGAAPRGLRKQKRRRDQNDDP